MCMLSTVLATDYTWQWEDQYTQGHCVFMRYVQTFPEHNNDLIKYFPLIFLHYPLPPPNVNSPLFAAVLLLLWPIYFRGSRPGRLAWGV